MDDQAARDLIFAGTPRGGQWVVAGASDDGGTVDIKDDHHAVTIGLPKGKAELIVAEHNAEIARLREMGGDYIELQRRAIAVTRIWDMLARCSDEFEPGDMAACGEYRDNLDKAIIGLMKMVDRPMWERREQSMKDSAERAIAATD